MSTSKYKLEIEATRRRRKHRQIDAEDYFDLEMGFALAEDVSRTKRRKIAIIITITVILLGIIIF